MKKRVWAASWYFLLLLLCLILPTIGLAEEQLETPFGGELHGIAPAEVAGLKAGLASWYYLDFSKRHLKLLPRVSDWPGQAGKPVLQLNHKFGKGQIFDSGTNRELGVRLTGFIHFDIEGVYNFQALSNDGVIVYIEKQVLLSDPQQHSDRLSEVGQIEIVKPGYYPISVEYFQRKGTAALKLFWQKPDNEELVPVPEKAYYH